MFIVGQGVLGKAKFVDGVTPGYRRPYLVVDVQDDGVSILNVSTTQDKEHKLLMETNLAIDNYNPPFIKPSFVKLDSKVFVSNEELSNFRLLKAGQCLNELDLATILSKI